MMDTSSLGKSYDEFCYFYNLLNESLDGIVNEYYGGFNDSILTFSGLHDKIQGASGSVNHVKNNLQKVRRMILEERGSLDQLYTKSNQLGAIVSILDRFEEVKKFPEELSGYVREKKFLIAANKLVQNMQFVFDPELNPIEALLGLRHQLEKEKSELLKMIIDELHNHIYLKSPYCERKMGVEGEDDDDEVPDSSSSGGNVGMKAQANKPGDASGARPRVKGSRKNKRAATAAGAGDDENPETDSFAYVEMLLESLAALDNTNEAMQEIKSSINLELSRLIDSVLGEVEERNRALIVKTRVADQQDDLLSQDTDREVLFDFSRIMFARLETVLEYHDYLLDVVNNMDRHDRRAVAAPGGFVTARAQSSQSYSIEDVWSAIRTEILALLNDYLIPEDRQLGGSMDAARGGSGMKTGIRDLFHMDKSADITDTVESLYLQIESHFQDLTTTIPKKKKETGAPAVIDEYADQQNSMRHRMLVEPSIDHAPTLLNMALSFTKRVSALVDSVPQGSLPASALSPSVRRSVMRDMATSRPTSPSQLASSYDDGDADADEYLQVFFRTVFLPRAEAYAMQLFDAVTSASDAFDIDLNTYFNGRPIFRSAAAIVPLLHSFGTLLNNLNSFKGDNWGILLQLANKYYEKCGELFRDTVRSPENQVYTSVKWSETPDLQQLFGRKLKQANARIRAPETGADIDREIRLEESLKTERSLHLSELIFDLKRLVCTAQLHQTLEWLLVQLNKVSADRAHILSRHDGATSVALLKKHEADKSKIVGRYTALSMQCLMVLRIEVHAHCTYYLDLATREGSYYLESDAVEPDQYIQALNADVSAIEDKMENCLPADRLALVFGGISVLMAHTLIANTRYIRHFNAAGNRKMIRNILALQQNLTNIALPEESGLDKARRFYELYDMGADGILKHIAENGVGFSFENYRRLVDFIYMGGSQAGESSAVTGTAAAGRVSSQAETKQNEDYDVYINRLRDLLAQSQGVGMPTASRPESGVQHPTSAQKHTFVKV
ncbi:Sec8 exocyst complex component-specific domain-containing protein [Kickxella alabastrina]|uniref:Sec8 exocyst complex component-specific domain-containing protein n=1 Tax=Kickxella alabastrina TaxID=61397 RepID=UPI002220B149|nr:Sec8 exocyst complex component-specific domain-containing protein [Kickxella alabastrina]KAI7829231.1 Sec8 exocyst complex component-specific domain-containing protein [Kickxella alabastrina]